MEALYSLPDRTEVKRAPGEVLVAIAIESLARTQRMSGTLGRVQSEDGRRVATEAREPATTRGDVPHFVAANSYSWWPAEFSSVEASDLLLSYS